MSEEQARETVAQIVSRETLENFVQIEQALLQWSRRFNLVAPSTLAHFWHRHVLDSVQLFALAPKTAKTWLDLGSGAGFPGMILAVMLKERVEAKMTLIESNGKKCSFLKHCARVTEAPANVIQSRIETAPELAADIITARALADLEKLLTLSQRFSRPQTVFLFPKGKNMEEELTRATKQWDIEFETVSSQTDPQARILCITRTGRI